MIVFKPNVNMNNVPKIGEPIDNFLMWLGNPEISGGGQFSFEITENNNSDYSYLIVTTYKNIVKDITFSKNTSDKIHDLKQFAVKFIPADADKLDTKEQISSEECDIPEATLLYSRHLEGNEGYIESADGHLVLYLMQGEGYASMTLALGKDYEIFN